MNKVKNVFKEFKSIFVSEDLLKENEEHANFVAASTMLNLFWMCLITWLLVYFNVFKLGLTIMNAVLIRAIIFLLIPAIICYIKKGKGKLLKHYLFISFTIMLGMTDAMLKYNVTLVMVLPVILAARYYNKKFTLSIAIFTTLLFMISAFFSTSVGQQDLNSYNLIIPKGTTFTVTSTLRNAILSIKVDEMVRLKNIFIHFFLPKMLVFNIIAFACVQISQSGKNMIKKQKEITENTARIETELNLARNIQRGMLQSIFPPFPEHEELDIYASMIPAKEVGGDFYDMFLIDDNHVAISVADVSGKGIPAALFMMISKILLQNIAMGEKKLDVLFEKVNKMLCEKNDALFFVTVWFGVLNIKTGKLTYVNAGHNPPLIYKKNTDSFSYLKSEHNMVLAGNVDAKYDSHEFYLEKGDRIFLYTDGVVESINNDKEIYGEKRLLEFLNNNKNLSVKDTIDKLNDELKKFSNGVLQFDDITMLELLYKNDSKIFKAKTDELTNVLKYINNKLRNKNIFIKELDLVVEEVFINICKYAYKDIGNVEIEVGFDNEVVNITFIDSGIPFNPISKKDPDILLDSKEREIGGLGIYLVKKIVDDIKYEYKDNKNVLTISKKQVEEL